MIFMLPELCILIPMIDFVIGDHKSILIFTKKISAIEMKSAVF
jgi:hypothetical protein